MKEPKKLLNFSKVNWKMLGILTGICFLVNIDMDNKRPYGMALVEAVGYGAGAASAVVWIAKGKRDYITE